MGNAESSSKSAEIYPGTDAPVRKPAAPPLQALQRKASSFLDEPIVNKHTDRGDARVTLGRRDDGRDDDGPGAAGMLRYAVSEMQGWRSHMEDKHALNPKLHANWQQKQLLRDHHLFAVFDGHGGDYASHFCGENFVSTLIGQQNWQAYLKVAGDGMARSTNRRQSVMGLQLLKSALIDTFLELDAKLMEAQRQRRLSQLSQLQNLVHSVGGHTEYDVFEPGTVDHQKVVDFSKQPPANMPANVPFERSGSTGVVVLITPSHILCANAGDSRAILSKRSSSKSEKGCEVLPLSFDHKPVNDVEVSRVEREGGFVRSGRVDGDLAVARSFGDFGYKNCHFVDRERRMPLRNKVTAHPDILVHTREPGRDEFIVLACDGIWDRLTNRDCADLVRSLAREGESDVGLICEEVIDTSLELDSRDNMTICAVFFPAAGIMGPSPSPSVGARGCAIKGVMKRRSERELQWGDGSTPAKRAQRRLDERRRKNRELVATQKAVVSQKAVASQRARAPRGPARRMIRQGPRTASSVERTRSGPSSASLSVTSVHQGRKHKAASSPPHSPNSAPSAPAAPRSVGRTRSGKVPRQ